MSEPNIPNTSNSLGEDRPIKPPSPSEEQVRWCVTELVAESTDPWNEEGDPRADVVAAYFGTTRHVQWLVGTDNYRLGLALWAAETGRAHTITYDTIRIGQRLAMEAWAPWSANQVVVRAARRTDIRRIDAFAGNLLQATWSEMATLAKRSLDYLDDLCIVDHEPQHRARILRSFPRLSDLQRVSLLTLRGEFGDYSEKLSAEEIAAVRGQRTKPKSVTQARSKARSEIGNLDLPEEHY